jgi:hypothetical protein
MSVLFSILFVTLFSGNFTSTYEERMPGSNIRIKVMDVYARNLETYIGQSIKVSTYRSLDAVTKYRNTSGLGFFSDSGEFNRTFSECLKCGYVNCSDQSVANNCSLGQYHLISRLEYIKNLSKNELNIKMEYSINNITIHQNYPFEVEVRVNISYNITDYSGKEYYARWDKSKVIIQPVVIIGLLDPSGYINDSTDKYNRTIKRYSGECIDKPSCWNPTTTEQFYNESSFRYDPNRGVSFLQRYWNDHNISSCCGIETILHPDELTNPNSDISFIDNYYWNSIYSCNNPGNVIYNITIDNDEISLDVNSTIKVYNLTVNDQDVICS